MGKHKMSAMFNHSIIILFLHEVTPSCCRHALTSLHTITFGKRTDNNLLCLVFEPLALADNFITSFEGYLEL